MSNAGRGRKDEPAPLPPPPCNQEARRGAPLWGCVPHQFPLPDPNEDGRQVSVLGLEESLELSQGRSLQPRERQNCHTDGQKIADDEFFRTALCVPVVAGCEIMCWPFWEHALLIRVCLVVYKKPFSPRPHCHLPAPHLLEEGQPPPKAGSVTGGAGLLGDGKARRCRSTQVSAEGWELTDATGHEGSKLPTQHIHFQECTFQNHFLSRCVQRRVYKDISGNSSCTSESEQTHQQPRNHSHPGRLVNKQSSAEEHGLWVQITHIRSSCVTLDKYLHSSGPQSLHLYNEERVSGCLRQATISSALSWVLATPTAPFPPFAHPVGLIGESPMQTYSQILT